MRNNSAGGGGNRIFTACGRLGNAGRRDRGRVFLFVLEARHRCTRAKSSVLMVKVRRTGRRRSCEYKRVFQAFHFSTGRNCFTIFKVRKWPQRPKFPLVSLLVNGSPLRSRQPLAASRINFPLNNRFDSRSALVVDLTLPRCARWQRSGLL